MDRIGKVQWREEMEQSFDKAGAFFVANYTGMTVQELSQLRRELRAAQAEMQVVKNTLVKKAIAQKPQEVASDLFKGQTASIFAYGDVAAAAKILVEAAKKNDKLKLVGGYMESSVLEPRSVEQLASLPSKEVLLSQIVGSLVAPHRGLLGVMQGVPRALVQALNQIKEQKAG